MSETTILTNQLVLAYTSEDEFAYAYKKSPGDTALTRGEIIHLIKYVPVEVTAKTSKNCYTEIVVDYKNTTAYLSPRNRSLKMIGTPLHCNALTPVMYHLALHSTPHQVSEPVILDLNPTSNWTYEPIQDLISSGLYSIKEIENNILAKTHVICW